MYNCTTITQELKRDQNRYTASAARLHAALCRFNLPKRLRQAGLLIGWIYRQGLREGAAIVSAGGHTAASGALSAANHSSSFHLFHLSLPPSFPLRSVSWVWGSSIWGGQITLQSPKDLSLESVNKTVSQYTWPLCDKGYTQNRNIHI